MKDLFGIYSHEETKVDEFHVDSMLYIKDIRDKNGTYVCSASDEKVRISDEVHLFVLGEDHIW